jgi:hypothetical protein
MPELVGGAPQEVRVLKFARYLRYVTCDTPQPLEMVFCDQGKLFDHERRTCRRIQPEDQCPHVRLDSAAGKISACRA